MTTGKASQVITVDKQCLTEKIKKRESAVMAEVDNGIRLIEMNQAKDQRSLRAESLKGLFHRFPNDFRAALERIRLFTHGLWRHQGGRLIGSQ